MFAREINLTTDKLVDCITIKLYQEIGGQKICSGRAIASGCVILKRTYPLIPEVIIKALVTFFWKTK